MKSKPRGARRRTSRPTELRRTSEQVARRRLIKDAARWTRLKEETTSLDGVALVTGALSLFAIAVAAAFVGVVLLVASPWGEDPRSGPQSRTMKAKPAVRSVATRHINMSVSSFAHC